MPRAAQYLIAVLLAFAAIGVRPLLDPLLHERLPYVTLEVAPVLCAWLFGRGPAVLALIVTAVGGAYFIAEPRFTLRFAHPEDEIGVFLYVGLTGIVITIVEAMHKAQKVAQRALARTLERDREVLVTTLRSILDAVVATDARGRITFINQVAAALTGWTEAQAEGKSWRQVFRTSHCQAWQSLDEPLSKALRERTPMRLSQALLISRDGKEIPIEVSAAPLGDETDTASGLVLVFRDLTERQQLEAERQALLAREQETRKEAERANHLKDEFLAIVSHELRTPLNAILGWCYVLKEQLSDPKLICQASATIERNARAQAQLIEDLLDVSRVLAGKLRLAMVSVDLREVAEAAVTTISPSARAKQQTIAVSAPEEALLVRGDPVRLQQVIWNLLSNAVKFTSSGGRIEVTLSIVDERARILVRDHGAGIAPELLPHVFERFRQADSRTSREHGGLGLGLAIVKYLVELHDGTVRGESAGIGHGATFAVELPLSMRTAAARIETLAQEETAEGTPLAGLTILALDDEADSLAALEQCLKVRGARVVTTGRAEDALRLAETGSFDLLICDLGMPVVDGYSFMQQLQVLVKERMLVAPPAIALTAHVAPDDISRSAQVGFRAHLAKPFKPEELVPTVLTVVTAGRSESARPLN